MGVENTGLGNTLGFARNAPPPVRSTGREKGGKVGVRRRRPCSFRARWHFAKHKPLPAGRGAGDRVVRGRDAGHGRRPPGHLVRVAALPAEQPRHPPVPVVRGRNRIHTAHAPACAAPSSHHVQPVELYKGGVIKKPDPDNAGKMIDVFPDGGKMSLYMNTLKVREHVRAHRRLPFRLPFGCVLW